MREEYNGRSSVRPAAEGYNPGNVEVPNKEIVGVVESVFGKTGAKVVITIIVIGAAITAIGGAWTTLKGFYEGAAPYLPEAVPSWLFNVASAVMASVLAALLVRAWARLKKSQDRMREQLAQIVAKPPMHADAEKVKALEDRVKYLEAKVGDELLDNLVAADLKAKGISKPGTSGYSFEQAMDWRWSVEEKHLVTRGRAMLFEAAQEARKTADAKGDLDKLTNQAWLILQIRGMITEGFGFRLFKEIEDQLEIREKKRKHEGRSSNATETLNFLADFCEAAIPGLKPDDVAEIYKLSPTFAEFMKSKQ